MREETSYCDGSQREEEGACRVVKGVWSSVNTEGRMKNTKIVRKGWAGGETKVKQTRVDFCFLPRRVHSVRICSAEHERGGAGAPGTHTRTAQIQGCSPKFSIEEKNSKRRQNEVPFLQARSALMISRTCQSFSATLRLLNLPGGETVCSSYPCK